MPASASSTPLVALRGVSKTFPTGTHALAGLELEVRAGEFLSLLGPSGCGKSTALRIIAGLSEPTEGAVEWAATAVPAENENRIGFVFQEPTLMPWANVFNNVLLPLNLHGAPAPQAAERVDRQLSEDTARPRAHHHDAVRQIDRLEHRMGDEHDRGAQRLPHLQQVVVELEAGDLVERREWLVHQQ